MKKVVFYILNEETNNIEYVTDSERNAYRVRKTYFNNGDYSVYAGEIGCCMYESLRATVNADIFDSIEVTM